MLETYTDFLNELSRSSSDDLAQRVALRLRFSSKPSDAEQYAESVRELILAMPKMAGEIHAWRRRPSLAADDQRFAFDLAALLPHPLDVIPHRGTLFSYLEEAYLTGYVFKRLSDIGEVHGGTGSLPLWLSHAKMVLPLDARRVERLVEEIFEKRGIAAAPVLQKPVSTRERLESAVRTLKGDQNDYPPFSEQYAAA